MAAYHKPDKINIFNGVKINEYLLTKHNPNRISMPTTIMNNIVGITIHNTEWIDVNSATTPAEQYTRATVNGNMKSTRVHYYVDNICAWQDLPLNLSGWHAADGNGNGNLKTIAIECIMSKNYNDKDKKSEDNCAKLAAYLLYKYELSIGNLYTHTYWLHKCRKKGYGVTGSVDKMNTANHPYKNCPAYILPHWNAFKEKVDFYLTLLKDTTATIPKSETVEFNSYTVKVISPDGFINIRKTPNWNDNDIVGKISTSNIKYTIVDETMLGDTRFGKLKSGAGWISLNKKYVEKV